MASRRTPIVLLNFIKSFGKSIFDITHIDENIYLSGEYNKYDLLRIKKLGIKCVLDMRSEIKFEKQEFDSIGIDYFNIPVDNFYPPNKKQTLDAINIIDTYIKSNQKILIHCKEGVGRSPFILIAYYITKRQDLYESIKLIKSKRWGVNLNKIQLTHIKKFYEKFTFN